AREELSLLIRSCQPERSEGVAVCRTGSAFINFRWKPRVGGTQEMAPNFLFKHVDPPQEKYSYRPVGTKVRIRCRQEVDRSVTAVPSCQLQPISVPARLAPRKHVRDWSETPAYSPQSGVPATPEKMQEGSREVQRSSATRSLLRKRSLPG